MVKKLNGKSFLAFIIGFLFFAFQPAFGQTKINSRVVVTIKFDRSYSKTFVYKISERIREFGAKYWIEKDGSVRVQEKIDYDFGANVRRGIYRYIPYVYKVGKKDFELEFFDFKVVDEAGRPYKFTLSSDEKFYYLKIGDPEKMVYGRKVYIISYKVKGAIRYFENYDEFYWDITGGGWKVPIEKAKAQVFLPKGAKQGDVKATCFTGGFGEAGKNCSVKVVGNVVYASLTKPLEPAEGLTIGVSFPKGLVAYLPAKERIDFFEDTLLGQVIFWSGVLALGLAAFFWYIFYPIKIALKWYFSGRDPKPNLGEAVAWFSPPKLKGRYLRPAEVGALVDERVDSRDIFATFVDLAVRGYIKIVEKEGRSSLIVKRSFYLEKREKDWKGLLPFERKLLEGVFEKGEKRVEVLKLTSFYKTSLEVASLLYKRLVEEGLLEKNPQKIRNFYTIMLVLGIVTINPLLVVSCLLFGFHLPRKTKLGAELAQQARALKRFLSSQDEKLEFQAKRLYLFEKLLPYAIAFGVEKVWVGRFKELLAKGVSFEWYSSASVSDSFYNAYLQGQFSSFSDTVFKITSSASASSGGFSSSFSSGFSGGGFGGGGGGSW